MGAHKASALNNKACPINPNVVDPFEACLINFNFHIFYFLSNLPGLYLKENFGLEGEVGLELLSVDLDLDRRRTEFIDNAEIRPCPGNCK